MWMWVLLFLFIMVFFLYYMHLFGSALLAWFPGWRFSTSYLSLLHRTALLSHLIASQDHLVRAVGWDWGTLRTYCLLLFTLPSSRSQRLLA
jgi:hypothetical protein